MNMGIARFAERGLMGQNGAHVFLLNNRIIYIHKRCIHIYTYLLTHTCSLTLFLLQSSPFHTHILSPHTLKHGQSHQLAYSCEDIVLNYINILGVFLYLLQFLFLSSQVQLNHKRYTSTSTHTHPYTQSMQIHEIVERRYQIMNPLPSLSVR